MAFDLEELKRFPKDPGVYIMKDKRGTALYVGKAKQLQSRVRQYFVPGGDERPSVPHLLARVETIDTVVVFSEKEALLLENTLIKRHKPKYNVILKDDKGYISLKLRHKHLWPDLRLVRYKGKPKKDGLYFGPYTSTYAARRTLDLLQRLFPLRRCTDSELQNRTRPCVLYQIKRCIAPCVQLCTREEYDALTTQVIRFLRGQDKEVLQGLHAQMEEASSRLEFERAQEILHTLRYLESTVEQQRVDQAGSEDRDVFALYREGSRITLSQMLFREGKLVGAQNYHYSSVLQDDAPLLASFLLQHYAEVERFPHEVIVPFPLEDAALLEEIFSDAAGRSVHIHVPQRGDKRALVAMAQANAASSFHREHDKEGVEEKTLLELQERLHLMNYPRRIECFDNSNFGGKEPVSALVAFLDGQKETRRYRRYRIRSAPTGDDYAALREALLRRYKRAQQEGELPDLVLVDGGRGHLNVANQVFHQLNIVTVDLVGLAKESGRHTKGLTGEQIILLEGSVHLGRLSPVLFFLQNVRDEAHRFAITYQRKVREKERIRTSLDDIPGIGPAKRKALLKRFGSVKGVLQATEEELTALSILTKRDIAALLEMAQVP